MSHRGSIAVLFAACLALPLAVACGKGKIAQCNSVVDVINAQVKAYNDAPEPKNDEDLKKLAAIFKKGSTDMGAVQLEDEKLKELSEKFKKSSTETATGIDAIADAKGDATPDEMKKAKDSMDKGMEGLKALTTSVNDYCK